MAGSPSKAGPYALLMKFADTIQIPLRPACRPTGTGTPSLVCDRPSNADAPANLSPFPISHAE
jgi:hypothetical protein